MIQRNQQKGSTLEGAVRYAGTRSLLEQFDSLVEAMGLCEKDKSEVLAARELSIRAHFHQPDRLDGQPYINHPLAVAVTLMRNLGVTDPDSVKAALLHDSVEDRAVQVIHLLRGTISANLDVQYEAQRLLRWAFGRRVGEMVSRLTNPDFHELAMQAQLKGDGRSESDLTVHFYKEHVVGLIDKDPDAFLVKLSDLYQNAFALEAVRDLSVQSALRKKYGATIREMIKKLEALPNSGHMLSTRATTLVRDLRDGYARHLASGPAAAA